METEIQSLNPGIRFVDLETDRGRVRPTGPSNLYDNDFDPGPGNEVLFSGEGGGRNNDTGGEGGGRNNDETGDRKTNQPEDNKSDAIGASKVVKEKNGIHII